LQITALIVIWIHAVSALFLAAPQPSSRADARAALRRVVLPILALLGDYRRRAIQALAPIGLADSHLQPDRSDVCQNAGADDRAATGALSASSGCQPGPAARAVRLWGSAGAGHFSYYPHTACPRPIGSAAGGERVGVSCMQHLRVTGPLPPARIRVMSARFLSRSRMWANRPCRPGGFASAGRLGLPAAPTGRYHRGALLPHTARPAIGQPRGSHVAKSLCRHLRCRHARLNPPSPKHVCIRHGVHNDRFIGAVDAGVVEAGGRRPVHGDGRWRCSGSTGAHEKLPQAIEALIQSAATSAALTSSHYEMADHPLRRWVAAARPVVGAYPLRPHACYPIRFGAVVAAGEAWWARPLRRTRGFTTLGNAANVASRLESLCKTYTCEAVIADDVCTWRAGLAGIAGARLRSCTHGGPIEQLALLSQVSAATLCNERPRNAPPVSARVALTACAAAVS